MPPREGAFAQYVSMPWENLVEVPDHVPFAKAALAEPLAVSWHAARLALEALHPAMERRALVIGGGAIGLAAALALRAMDVVDVTIVEPNDLRREFPGQRLDCAFKLVARAAQPEFPLAGSMLLGIAATRATASAIAAQPGGVIAHVGLGEDTGGLDIRRMTLQEITFIGTYTYTARRFPTHRAGHLSTAGSGRAGLDRRTGSCPMGGRPFANCALALLRSPKIILNPWE